MSSTVRAFAARAGGLITGDGSLHEAEIDAAARGDKYADKTTTAR